MIDFVTHIGLLRPGNRCLMDKTFRECGAGWSGLIDPIETEIERLGGTVEQIKEKFGGLRLYYSSGNSFDDPAWAGVERSVEEAESASRLTCEMCGKPGVMRTSGHWLKTLCDLHALDLGYKQKV